MKFGDYSDEKLHIDSVSAKTRNFISDLNLDTYGSILKLLSSADSQERSLYILLAQRHRHVNCISATFVKL